jgi:hypothetical protein
MSVMFVEYKVDPEKRERYLQWIRDMNRKEPRFELLEGSDQPHLFVEIWRGISFDEYAKLKQERLGLSPSAWSVLAEYVPGGADRIHIWHFRSVR